MADTVDPRLVLFDGPPGHVRLGVVSSGVVTALFTMTPGEADALSAAIGHAADRAAGVPAATHSGGGGVQ